MAFCCCCCSWIIYTCVVNLKSKLENKKKTVSAKFTFFCCCCCCQVEFATQQVATHTQQAALQRSAATSKVLRLATPKKTREIERGKKKRKNKWVPGNGENRFYCISSSGSPKGTWLFVGQAIKRIRAQTNTCKHTLRQQLKAAAVESNESFPSDDESFSLSIFNEKRLGKAHKRPLLWKIQLSCGFNVAESICQVRGKAKGKVKTFPKS